MVAALERSRIPSVKVDGRVGTPGTGGRVRRSIAVGVGCRKVLAKVDVRVTIPPEVGDAVCTSVAFDEDCWELLEKVGVRVKILGTGGTIRKVVALGGSWWKVLKRGFAMNSRIRDCRYCCCLALLKANSLRTSRKSSSKSKLMDGFTSQSNN